MEGTQEQIPLQELAAKIAAALGEGWKYDGKLFNDCGALISRPEGLSLFLSNTWGPKGSLHISGRFPEGRGSDQHTINVSLARSPEVMVREIRRRLLPDYMVAFGIADKKKQEDDACAQGKRDTARRFKVVNFDFVGEPVGCGPDCLTFFFDGGDGRVDAPGEVRLVLYGVPEDTARQIIRLLVLANAEKARQLADATGEP